MSIADIEQARRNTAVARARMQSTLGALKYRLSPATIAADTKRKVLDTSGAIGARASKVVNQHPVATTGAAGVAALILFRKPIVKIAKWLSRRRKSHMVDPAPARTGDLIRAGDPPAPSITPRIQRAVAGTNAAAQHKE